MFIIGISEILKQVWDLSDEDNDSMLSLKEFCIALYLMERFREGRPLPKVLPPNIFEGQIPAASLWRPPPGPGIDTGDILVHVGFIYNTCSCPRMLFFIHN